MRQKLDTVPLGDHPFYGQDVYSSSLGWAMSAASSRAFRLHGEIPMLLPLIDMCNHSFNPNARIVQEGSVNSSDMSVKASILRCSSTSEFSIYMLLKILLDLAIIFALHISTSQTLTILLYILSLSEHVLFTNFCVDLYSLSDTLTTNISVAFVTFMCLQKLMRNISTPGPVYVLNAW